MRETIFIEQNKDKWERLEFLLEQKQKNPEELSELFIQITDDLSYARTFFPNRSVRVYLNGLAQRLFSTLYSTKRSKSVVFMHFWKDELPQIIYESRRAFRISLFVFLLAMTIGMLSSHMDPNFSRFILGDSYIEMTQENINSGDPMAVYKDKGAYGMWLGITANNLWIAFLTFISGVLYGIGSIVILIKNGVMVGAFQWFFVEKGLFWESFLGIWTHGTLEISAIIIAGAAGLTMGQGLVFPGTLSRIKAFQISARRGLKILIGIAPLILMAGFIESFLTRQTDTPDVIRLLFILICLFFVLGYFYFYPMLKARKGFVNLRTDLQIPPDVQHDFSFQRIKTVGEIFSDVFMFHKKYFKTIGLSVLGVSILWILIAIPFSNTSPSLLFNTSSEWKLTALVPQLLFHEQIPWLMPLNATCFGILSYVVFQKLCAETGQNTPSFLITDIAKIGLPAIGLALVLSTSSSIFFILMLVLFPMLLFYTYVTFVEKGNIINLLSISSKLLGSAFWRMMGVYAIILLTGSLFMLIVDTIVVHFFLAFINMNISFNAELNGNINAMLIVFASLLVMFMVFTLLLIGMGFLYHTLLEIKEARNLQNRIDRIGALKKLKGIDWEGNINNSRH